MPESARHRWEVERAANGPLVTLTLTTRVPSKWVAVDRETGHCWEWRHGAWKKATPLVPAPDPDDEQQVEALAQALAASFRTHLGYVVTEMDQRIARSVLTFLRDGGRP